MGVKNYVIDGVSCAGKTTVCNELQRRGYHAIHGDRALAYWGDPNTGAPVPGGAGAQRTWMWNVATVSALVADHTHAATFFCGGSRNADRFIDMWDGVFVLAIDLATLNRRLAARPADAWGESALAGEAFARVQHATHERHQHRRHDALSRIVDTILDHAPAVAARHGLGERECRKLGDDPSDRQVLCRVVIRAGRPHPGSRRLRDLPASEPLPDKHAG